MVRHGLLHSPLHRAHRRGRPRALGLRTRLRLRGQGRTVSAAIAGGSVLAGFGLTVGILQVVRGENPAAPAQRVAESMPGHPDRLSPGGLDAQWLFYSDHSGCADWAGGDGVSAVRLSSDQIAWFFADTFLGPAGPRIGFSHTSGFVHNSVVMQTTAGSRTSLVTLTGGSGCTSRPGPGAPVSVVAAPATAGGLGLQRFWDADGIKVGGTVVKFYNGYLLSPIPYVPTGTTIARFSVSQLSRAGRGRAPGGSLEPTLTPVPGYTPPGGGTPIIWGSALLRSGRTVYVYGWQSASASSTQRLLYLARVSAARLADFASWRFYMGGKWASSQRFATPIEPFYQNLTVPSGFSVVPIAGRYWLIQAAGAGNPDIYAYPAPAPWGPFDAYHGVLLYRAPGIGLTAADDYRVLYEARAEPALSTGKTLIISYNVNSEAVTGACLSISHFTNAIIQPRFIAVPRRVFTAPGGSVQNLVRAAPPGYPQLVQRHPEQWYDSWSFPGGCPPVPGVSSVAARARPGLIRLTWPSAAIGMRYRIYLSTGSGYRSYAHTSWAHGVTITGLSSGVTYYVKVVPVNVHLTAGPAAYTSVRVP